MKPLTLTIHPRLEDTNLTRYERWEGERTTLRLRDAKRLTDTELAAEYWAAGMAIKARGLSGREWFTEYDRQRTLHRFATLPHHDEATP